MTATAAVRDLGRRLRLGRAALMLYHRPLGLVLKSIAEGGPLEQRRTELGRRDMIAAAVLLPVLISPTADNGARVAFLSGAQYWYQTLFCFVSLQVQTPERITPVIHDDGTFTNETRGFIRRVVPWAEFIDYATIEDRLDRLLPAATFPSLRARRIEYAHLRKLTDIHLCAMDWTLVLDSDMLFFLRPDIILSWFRCPHPMFMQDVETSYGYSCDLLVELARGPLPDRVNVGLYAVHSPSIDWHHLEFACRSQIEREGRHYLQEQALTALLLSGGDAKSLPVTDYVVLPSLEEGEAPTAVLHHYVGHSRRSYFQHGWRHVAARIKEQSRGQSHLEISS